MIFNDYALQHKANKEFFELKEVQDLKTNLELIRDIYKQISISVITKLAQSTTDNNRKIQIYNELTSRVTSLIQNTTKIFSSIIKNIFVVNKKLQQTDLIKDIDLLQEFEKLLSELNNEISDIAFELNVTNKIDLITKAQQCINDVINIIENNMRLYNAISEIEENLKCNQDVVIQNGLQTFKIVMHGYKNDYDYILETTQSLKQIYDIACNMFNLKGDDRKLIPIKTESGCWYQELAGNPIVVWFVTYLLENGIKAAYNFIRLNINLNPSSKSLRSHLEEALKIHDTLDNFIDENKDKGIEINEDYLAVEAIGQIVKPIIDIAKNNKQIRINEFEFSIEQEISKTQMIEFKMKYLENKEE